MSVIAAETFTNISERVSGSILAILEGKNTMAANVPARQVRHSSCVE